MAIVNDLIKIAEQQVDRVSVPCARSSIESLFTLTAIAEHSIARLILERTTENFLVAVLVAEPV
jgi:hypothetical protein